MRSPGDGEAVRVTFADGTYWSGKLVFTGSSGVVLEADDLYVSIPNSAVKYLSWPVVAP